jgi:hypothetical protein
MSGLSPLRQVDDLRDRKTGRRLEVPKGEHWYKNNVYTVIVDSNLYTNKVERYLGMPVLHLSIKRNDRKPIDSWADLQWIKNQIAGPEAEAVQLFPAESRMLEAANQYHLWVIPGTFPIGFFPDGPQLATPEEAAEYGAVQSVRQK